MDSEIVAAENLFREGRHKEALERLGAVLEADPRNKRALRSLGAVCHAQGLRDKAVKAFESLLALDSEDLEARRGLVAAFLADGFGRDPEAAKGHLERLLASNQNEWGLWNALARLEAELGRPEAALAAIEKSLLQKPDQPEMAKAQASLRSKIPSSAGGSSAGSKPSSPGGGPRPSSGKPSLMVRGRPAVTWLFPPELEAEAAVISEPLSKCLSLTRVSSLKFEAYLDAASKGDSPLWLEGAGSVIAKLLAAFPFPGRRVVLSLSSDDVLTEAFLALNLSQVSDIVTESPFLRELLARRLREAGAALLPGAKLHVAPRAVDYEKLPRRKDAPGDSPPIRDLVFPGPQGPLSGLRETVEAFAFLRAANPDLKLFLGGPFQGGVWEALLAHLITKLSLGDSLAIAPKGLALGAFLGDKRAILTAPAAGVPKGMLEALDLGLAPLVKSAPGLEIFGPLVDFWSSPEELAEIFSKGRSLSPEGRAELRSAHEPSAVARRRLEILAAS